MNGTRNSSLLGKITVLVVICCCSLSAQGKYGGGTGEPNDPYLIYTAEQMNEIGLNEDDWDKHFKLMADIDLSGYTGPGPWPPPTFARNPNPVDWGGVNITVVLSWTAGLGATSHDVYFGTSNPPPFIQNQTATTFDPGTLAYLTKYYWRIDEVNNTGKTTGIVWRFTTSVVPPPPPGPPPSTMIADVDPSVYTETIFNIIGRSYDYPFTGVFDGSSHTISNFTYDSNGTDCIGLFGCVGGVIKDLGLIDPNVDAGTGCFIGALVGKLRYGTIANCYVDGAAVAGTESVGGLVGQNGVCYYAYECHGGKMSNCYSTGTVSGYSAVGGLVGKSNGGTIYNCCSESVVSGTTGIGGLLGYNEDGAIFNSYSHSDVSGNEQVGGLLGSNYWGTVSSSYSTGGVSGDDHVGGLAGHNSGGGFASSFWDTQTSGQTTSAGGTPKTTAEMQIPSTFMDAGWDFVGKADGPHDIWAEPSGGGYPILCWQLPPVFGLPGFSGGLGTADDPYLISTADELNSIGHNPRLMAAHFKLIDDIDLTGTDLFLIGSELFRFSGVFDGNGRKISNFTYSSTDADKIGLFTYVYGENALIKDLGLIAPDVNVGTGYFFGSLVGRLFEGKVTGCYVKGGSVAGYGYVGGGCMSYL